MDCKDQNVLIQKQTLAAGKMYIPLKAGTRVKFHFQTRKVNDGTILDDSRKMNHPMELVLGKKFKLEVWEVIVQKMALHEVAKFTVHKSLVIQYPFVSKALRDMINKKEHHHRCGMTMNEGLGYKDLDDLLKSPTDLEFTIDLFSIELPESYEKENWQLNDEEKLKMAEKLKLDGNKLYQKQEYAKAEECYKRAVGMIEQLMIKEKPRDTEWLELAKVKVPLLLNYAQCRLKANDYYAVIQHCTEILELEPNNVKAIYRRAKAHFNAWNPEEARRDFKTAQQLDSTLKNAIDKELQAIDLVQQKRDKEDKLYLQKLFSMDV